MISKQEGDKRNPSNSRRWSSRYRNPRIVRVSNTFGGKDRHSKVCTIRGLRDRRIRLSAPTAIQLYDLQDKLDLGQPSKVIDWLLNLAKDDIDKLPPLPFPPLGFDHLLLNPQETSNFPPNYNPLSLVTFLEREKEKKEMAKWVIASDGQSSSSFISTLSSHNSSSSSSPFSDFPSIGSTMAFNQRNLHFCPPSLSLSQIGYHTHHFSQDEINNGNSKSHQMQPLSQLIFYPQASIVPPSIPYQPFPPRDELEDPSRRTFQKMFTNASNYGYGKTQRNDGTGEEDHYMDRS